MGVRADQDGCEGVPRWVCGHTKMGAWAHQDGCVSRPRWVCGQTKVDLGRVFPGFLEEGGAEGEAIEEVAEEAGEIDAEAVGDEEEGVEAEVEIGLASGGEAEFSLVLVANGGVFFDLAGAEVEDAEEDLEGADGGLVEGLGVGAGAAGAFVFFGEPSFPVGEFLRGEVQGGWGLIALGGGRRGAARFGVRLSLHGE
jgi:hypothetical protein